MREQRLIVKHNHDFFFRDLSEARRAQRNIRGELESIREAAFKKALAEEYGVVGNPKFDQCYSIAYSQVVRNVLHGHSSGYSEVENVFDDLVVLIK